jgi:hypothetical protein
VVEVEEVVVEVVEVVKVVGDKGLERNVEWKEGDKYVCTFFCTIIIDIIPR